MPSGERPDIAAARRGGDWGQPMDGEVVPARATMAQATYWKQVYTEILEMEEQVLDRVHKLMATQSSEVQQEVALTNVPVIVAQVERFRQRLSYWHDRLQDLNGAQPSASTRRPKSESDG